MRRAVRKGIPGSGGEVVVSAFLAGSKESAAVARSPCKARVKVKKEKKAAEQASEARKEMARKAARWQEEEAAQMRRISDGCPHPQE